MSHQIRRTVETTWREHIGLPTQWSPTQIDSFLDQQTASICAEIERRMGTAQGPAVARWKAEHPGREPDYLTLVALINTGRAQVTEEVLSEALYEKVPEPDDSLDDLPVEPTSPVASSSPDRWRFPDQRTPEPDADLDALADRLLPHRSTLVRVMAEYLLQVMREDRQPLPNGPDDPAMSSFINRLEAGMLLDGQPLDGPGALVETR